MVPVREVIEKALRTIGASRPGEVLNEATLECLEILNQILAVNAPGTREIEMRLSPGCQDYVLDDDVNAVLAVEAIVPVEDGRITANVLQISEAEFLGLPIGNRSQLPQMWAVRGGWPVGIRVWPAPDRRFALRVTVATTAAKAEIDDLIEAPGIAVHVLTLNLGIELCPPFGVTPDPGLLQEAQMIGRTHRIWPEIRIIPAAVNFEIVQLLSAKAVLLRQLEKLKKAA